MKKRIYIAGCGGMLGEAFHKLFSHEYELKCTDKDVNDPWLSFMDFRDPKAYLKDVVDFRPDYLFHLGAHTDLELCEFNPDDTFATNAQSVVSAVKIANMLDIPLLYISTAGIFDGQQSQYDESDRPNPLGIYALTKYMGELHVLNTAKRGLVCRAGWMMGGGPEKDKKFIQKIMSQIKNGARELFIVNDKDGTPTYTHDFAANVKLLIEREQTGLFNMVCGGQTSRFEVAQELLKILGLQDEIKLTPVTSEHFKHEYFAMRPACERLVNARLNEMGLNIMRDWRIALNEYINDYYFNYIE